MEKSNLSSAYEVAKVNLDQIYVENSGNYKTPTVVAKLPPRENLNTGKIETVDEVTSESDYYDGSKKLKITVVNCNQWISSKEACLHQGSCGWCGSSNSCISGNSLGPTAPCLRGTFQFSAPKDNFNPLNTDNVVINRANIGGAQLTTITAAN